DLAGDTVGVKLLVTTGRVPPAAESLFVLLLPFAGELLVHHAHDLAEVGAHGGQLPHVLIEGVAVLGVEVRAVVLTRQAGVAVRGDDEVLAHRHRSFRGSGTAGPGRSVSLQFIAMKADEERALNRHTLEHSLALLSAGDVDAHNELCTDDVLFEL